MATLLNFLTPSLQENLSLLKYLLSNLPLSVVPNGAKIYCFHQFPGLDAELVEDNGSEMGALNHELEVILGRDRDTGLIVFREQGPSLTAVVDVIERYMTGSDGENILLIKWINDLLAAARAIFERAERGGASNPGQALLTRPPRIIGHAVEECNFISSELRQLALDHAGDLSLGSK
ncbi:hypothetical protein EWM64_g5117, partial [Hericium alpestre]